MSGQRDWPKVLLRLPPDLKAFIMTETSRNGSSQNSEVVRSIRERMDRQRAGMPGTHPLA